MFGHSLFCQWRPKATRCSLAPLQLQKLLQHRLCGHTDRPVCPALLCHIHHLEAGPYAGLLTAIDGWLRGCFFDDVISRHLQSSKEGFYRSEPLRINILYECVALSSIYHLTWARAAGEHNLLLCNTVRPCWWYSSKMRLWLLFWPFNLLNFPSLIVQHNDKPKLWGCFQLSAASLQHLTSLPCGPSSIQSGASMLPNIVGLWPHKGGDTVSAALIKETISLN